MASTRTPQPLTRRSRSSAAIDVESSINSGQVFLWERDGDLWRGIDGAHAITVDASRAVPRVRSHAGRAPDIFRQDDDIGAILRDISRDAAVAAAVARLRGMRLMRQDPFQCLVTFITSANSNIPRIRGTLRRLCERYGERAGGGARLFPEPRRLARAGPAGLAACGLGYRAPYVRRAAAMVDSGGLDLRGIAGAPWAEAMESLLGVPGVGCKVADCVMLFSLERLDAFPLDRWMARILASAGGAALSRRIAGLTPRRYAEVHAEAVRRYGRHAGYAQQFLFKAGRDDARGAWAVNP